MPHAVCSEEARNIVSSPAYDNLPLSILRVPRTFFISIVCIDCSNRGAPYISVIGRFDAPSVAILGELEPTVQNAQDGWPYQFGAPMALMNEAHLVLVGPCVFEQCWVAEFPLQWQQDRTCRPAKESPNLFRINVRESFV